MSMTAIYLIYFYKLVDPRDNLPFYVGQTVDPERRLKDYLNERPQHSRALDKRIDELRQAGLQPIMQELERKDCTAEGALVREAYWIHFFESQGIALLNRSNNKERREQQTIYLPPALAKWLKVHAAEADLEISEIAALAFKEYQERHS
jgi:hypothetical protein